MSAFVRHAVRFGRQTVNFKSEYVTGAFINNSEKQLKRYLYGPSALGIDKFLEARTRSAHQLGPMKDKFREKMIEYLNSSSNNIVFTEDLRNMIHLVENNDDLDLCHKMMVKFNNQDSSLRFGSYVFGPVIMRMYHHLNKPKEAVEMFTAKELVSMFNQVTSYFILMDLLYKGECYQDVLDMFVHLQSNQTFISRFPRECVILTLASCFKLNTKESFEYGLDLLKKAQKTGAIILRKGLTFLVKLALNQQNPATALEILSIINQTNYITVRNLKIMTLADLDRIDDCFVILRNLLEAEPQMQYQDYQKENSGQICTDTIQRLATAVEKMESKEMSHTLEQYIKALNSSNQIKQMTLDELLCQSVPQRVIPSRENMNDSRDRNTQQQHRNQRYDRRSYRQGLADMD